MNKGLADRIYGRALELEAQCKSRKNVVELSYNLRLTLTPSFCSCERHISFSVIPVIRQNCHRQLVSTLFPCFVSDQLPKHLREEFFRQVTRFNKRAAKHGVIFG